MLAINIGTKVNMVMGNYAAIDTAKFGRILIAMSFRAPVATSIMDTNLAIGPVLAVDIRTNTPNNNPIFKILKPTMHIKIGIADTYPKINQLETHHYPKLDRDQARAPGGPDTSSTEVSLYIRELIRDKI